MGVICGVVGEGDKNKRVLTAIDGGEESVETTRLSQSGYQKEK